ncbi:MAG: hypothetical protein ABI901_07770 [Roseiflexaceae bacterium]
MLFKPARSFTVDGAGSMQVAVVIDATETGQSRSDAYSTPLPIGRSPSAL